MGDSGDSSLAAFSIFGIISLDVKRLPMSILLASALTSPVSAQIQTISSTRTGSPAPSTPPPQGRLFSPPHPPPPPPPGWGAPPRAPPRGLGRLGGKKTPPFGLGREGPGSQFR